jgi:hypothetical protein
MPYGADMKEVYALMQDNKTETAKCLANVNLYDSKDKHETGLIMNGGVIQFVADFSGQASFTVNCKITCTKDKDGGTGGTIKIET